MTRDDITQKLALLPKGLSENNIQTWQASVKNYERLVLETGRPRYQYLLDLVQNILRLEDAKLFNSFPDLWMLMISTRSSLGDSLGHGIPFIVVGVKDNEPTVVSYYTSAEQSEYFDCKSNDIMPTLQPLLDRLWSETWGKKDAS